MGTRAYRFHRAGLFLASCQMCHCVVPKRQMEDHALWHARLGHHEPVQGTIRTYCDVTILHKGGKATAHRSGWLTIDKGPK